MDDSETIRRVLSRAFTGRGYDTITAGDAAEARRLFARHTPEIVVLDYHLPDGSGEDLLAEFSRASHFSVFVMITTDPKPDLALRWMQMGAAAYARKPFEPEYLLALCENAARERVMMRVEELLEHKTQCLIQAQKMEAVGQMAGGVAHDFNNLLQVIYGYSEMALIDLEHAHPAAAESLHQLLKASERARRLVVQLLAFSRNQGARPEPLALNTLLENEIHMTRRVTGAHIEFVFNPEPGLPAVLADAHQVEQAVLNLCLNARDAMPDGGRLTIATCGTELDAARCLNRHGARPGRYTCIEVFDTGSGIPPEVKKHIFEPFYTTKKMGRGTGLGLSIVYGIVSQSNGFIEVDSTPGRGSTFRIFLPAADTAGQEDQTAAPLHPAGKKPAGGTERILLAEDEELVRTLSERYLIEAGYHVVTAVDGKEAVGRLETQGRDIDLLLLDVVMPGKNGRQVLDAARDLGFGVPVLFISGYSFDSLDNGRLPPGTRLLKKPFTHYDLLAAVRQACDDR
ncbi:MAG: response regulator [Deltaproteobacteria bacterium]|nr:response regulator [Candidatus Anaeroferrophillacea bacterium]